MGEPIPTFEDFLESDNVIKTGEDQYIEHCTQWRKTFTRAELYDYWKREYDNE